MAFLPTPSCNTTGVPHVALFTDNRTTAAGDIGLQKRSRRNCSAQINVWSNQWQQLFCYKTGCTDARQELPKALSDP
jgi:hypothetical protein